MAVPPQVVPPQAAPPPRGPVTSGERSLAPDFARGLMLLLIALANTPWFLYGSTTGITTVHPTDGSTLDRITQGFIITAVDARIYPLFAFLFGYGIVQLYNRQRQAGAEHKGAARLLIRRHLWMLVFGAVHAALLWMGDVIGAWGLAGLVVAGLFLRVKDRTLLLWAGVFLVLVSLLLAMNAAFTALFQGAEGFEEGFLGFAVSINGEENYGLSIVWRFLSWIFIAVGQGLFSPAIVMMVLAFWAARRRILEEPGQHLSLLRRTAVVGVSIGILGGLPHALYHLGHLGDNLGWLFGLTHPLTGFFGALGYVALLTLIAHRIQSRGRSGAAPVVFLQGIGKRSLSNYLGQSVLFAPLLAGWGFALGGWIGSAATAGIAIAGWLLLGLISSIWERRDYRGPAETLLRRLVYKSAGSGT